MHSWYKYCVDANVFNEVVTLRKFIEVLRKQSNSDEAIIPYREDVSLSSYDEDGEFVGKIKAPRYFGAGVEALAETFFEVFGSEYNLAGYKSQDSVDEDLEDTGYDAIAYTAKEKRYDKGTEVKKISQPGNRVYVQVKGVLNPTKEFTTNDGSRIMNFYGNAQGHCRMIGEAYGARFMLFTTGKGLHYKLAKNTRNEIEIVNYSAIERKINNNPFFWNALYTKLGLPESQIVGPKDPEFVCIEEQLKILVDE
jgi:hypothetical protein